MTPSMWRMLENLNNSSANKIVPVRPSGFTVMVRSYPCPVLLSKANPTMIFTNNTGFSSTSTGVLQSPPERSKTTRESLWPNNAPQTTYRRFGWALNINRTYSDSWDIHSCNNAEDGFISNMVMILNQKLNPPDSSIMGNWLSISAPSGLRLHSSSSIFLSAKIAVQNKQMACQSIGFSVFKFLVRMRFATKFERYSPASTCYCSR